MNDRAVAVVELMLTAHVYERTDALDADDLPPAYRSALWKGGDEAEGLEPPVPVTEGAAREALGVEDPWEAISGLLFTDRDTFSGTLKFADADLAREWYADRTDAERLARNPVLAHEFADEFDVSHDEARTDNPPARADRAWIDSMLAEHFDEDEEEEGDGMLDLIEVKAPSEIQLTLDDLVLTEDQETEIKKVAKAIEHRDYLARIGLREIGKLLFVGPPGTGKTSTARGLAHEMDLPFVEVKLSMITSQYLGETAKNVEKVFEAAKRLSPCILFIDEFDFVAKTRRSDEHAAIKRAVNTLLKSIDEVSLVRDEVLLIGATNHPDQLDSAAWRRFDEILEFPEPDRQMRADILRVVTREMEIAEFDPNAVAERTEGLTGSDLRLVLREAVLDALVEDRTSLTQEDIMAAVANFERRDNLKRMGGLSGEDAVDAVSGNEGDADGHDHGEHADHDHAAHDHEGATHDDHGSHADGGDHADHGADDHATPTTSTSNSSQ